MDTRGILRPDQVGRAFELERPAVAADLRRVVASHWAVTWSLPAGVTKRSEVLTHPAVHLVAEPDGVFVYGVRRELYVRVLCGSGFAVGSRMRPVGQVLHGEVDELAEAAGPEARPDREARPLEHARVQLAVDA